MRGIIEDRWKDIDVHFLMVWLGNSVVVYKGH